MREMKARNRSEGEGVSDRGGRDEGDENEE